jgi:hypothetical protein
VLSTAVRSHAAAMQDTRLTTKVHGHVSQAGSAGQSVYQLTGMCCRLIMLLQLCPLTLINHQAINHQSALINHQALLTCMLHADIQLAADIEAEVEELMVRVKSITIAAGKRPGSSTGPSFLRLPTSAAEEAEQLVEAALQQQEEEEDEKKVGEGGAGGPAVGTGALLRRLAVKVTERAAHQTSPSSSPSSNSLNRACATAAGGGYPQSPRTRPGTAALQLAAHTSCPSSASMNASLPKLLYTSRSVEPVFIEDILSTTATASSTSSPRQAALLHKHHSVDSAPAAAYHLRRKSTSECAAAAANVALKHNTSSVHPDVMGTTPRPGVKRRLPPLITLPASLLQCRSTGQLEDSLACVTSPSSSSSIPSCLSSPYRQTPLWGDSPPGKHQKLPDVLSAPSSKEWAGALEPASSRALPRLEHYNSQPSTPAMTPRSQWGSSTGPTQREATTRS